MQTEKAALLLTVHFVDDSEIDFYSDHSQTIWRGTKGYLAYDLWRIACKDRTLKVHHISIFADLVKLVAEPKGAVTKFMDYRTAAAI